MNIFSLSQKSSRQSIQPAKPQTSQFQQSPVNLASLSAFSSTQILQLQRTLGNQATQNHLSSILQSTNSAFIQRDHTNNPDDFINWMKAHDVYKTNKVDDAGQCAPAAKAIAEVLGDEGMAFQFRAILMFHRPLGRTSNMNMNHFVIVATVGGQKIVIDSTQGQFEGGSAMVAREADWRASFRELKARVVVSQTGNETEWRVLQSKYLDVNSWEDAKTYGNKWKATFDEETTGNSL